MRRGLALLLSNLAVTACAEPFRPDAGLNADASSPLAARSTSGVSISATVLPSLGGSSAAYAINDIGTVVGWSYDESKGQGFAVTWVQLNGTWTIQPLPEGAGATAYAVNATGDIVGRDAQDRAILWPNGGGGSPRPLSTSACEGHPGQETAQGISTLGRVVGWVSGRAVLWESSGASGCPAALPDLEGGSWAFGKAISSNGRFAAGKAWRIGSDEEHPVRWHWDGSVWQVTQLSPDSIGHAEAVNASGDAAGGVWVCPGAPPDGCRHFARLWPAGGAPMLLSLGGTWSNARGINDAGDVVGYSSTKRDPAPHAFLFIRSTQSTLELSMPTGYQTSDGYGVTGRTIVGGRTRWRVAGQARSSSGRAAAVIWDVGVQQ